MPSDSQHPSDVLFFHPSEGLSDLSEDMRSEEIKRFFGLWGRVNEVYLHPQKSSGGKWWGKVFFDKSRDASIALQESRFSPDNYNARFITNVYPCYPNLNTTASRPVLTNTHHIAPSGHNFVRDSGRSTEEGRISRHDHDRAEHRRSHREENLSGDRSRTISRGDSYRPAPSESREHARERTHTNGDSRGRSRSPARRREERHSERDRVEERHSERHRLDSRSTRRRRSRSVDRRSREGSLLRLVDRITDDKRGDGNSGVQEERSNRDRDRHRFDGRRDGTPPVQSKSSSARPSHDLYPPTRLFDSYRPERERRPRVSSSPPPDQSPEGSAQPCTVWVCTGPGRSFWDKETIAAEFGKWGDIVTVDEPLQTDILSSSSKRSYFFVVFATRREARKAISEMTGRSFGGSNRIECRISTSSMAFGDRKRKSSETSDSPLGRTRGHSTKPNDRDSEQRFSEERQAREAQRSTRSRLSNSSDLRYEALPTASASPDRHDAYVDKEMAPLSPRDDPNWEPGTPPGTPPQRSPSPEPSRYGRSGDDRDRSLGSRQGNLNSKYSTSDQKSSDDMDVSYDNVRYRAGSIGVEA